MTTMYFLWLVGDVGIDVFRMFDNWLLLLLLLLLLLQLLLWKMSATSARKRQLFQPAGMSQHPMFLKL